MAERPPADIRGEEDPVPQELTGTVLRGAGLAGLGFVLSQVLALGFYLALARIATPEDFGEFAAAAIVINTGLLFTESGMLAALIHRRDRVDEAASTAVISTALGGLLFSAIAVALSPVIALIFDSDRVGTLSAALAGILLVRSLQVVPEALLQRRFSFLRRMVVEPLQMIAFGVAAIIATSNDMGAWGLVIGYYAAAVTDVVLSWALVRWRPRFGLANMGMWRELIAYGRQVLASNLVLRAGQQVPTVLIGRYVGQNPLGQYRYADRIASTPLALIVSGAAFVVLPAFARISQERERFSAAFLRSLRWFSVLAMPLGLILIPLGIPLAVVLFGEIWRDAGEAAMALSLYTVGASLVSVASESYKAEGRPEILIHVHVVSMVTATIAMVALLPFDLVGVVAGMSIGLAIGSAYALARAARMLEIPGRSILAQLWPPAVAALVMIAALFPLDRLVLDPASHATAAAVALLAAEGLAGLALYTLVLLVLAPDTLAEVRDLLSAARRRGDASPAGPESGRAEGRLGRYRTAAGRGLGAGFRRTGGVLRLPVRAVRLSLDAAERVVAATEAREGDPERPGEPRFSVIVPAHNEADLVGSAITSVLRQSADDWELLVVDDGSTDGTADVVRGFERDDPRISLVRQRNQGLSAARNTGIARSRGRYLGFLDSDDLWMPDYLARMGAALEAAPGAGFAYTDAWALDADSRRIRRSTAMSEWNPPERPPRDPLEMMRLMLRGNFVFVSTTVPRAVLEDVGGFDTSLRSSEDYDLWLRILAAGYPGVTPGGVLAIKRERPTAMSANHLKMASNQSSVCRRVAADPSLPDDIRAMAAARASWLDSLADALQGRNRPRAAVMAVRRLLSPLRNALQPSRRWRRRPPAEVAEAFPDLESR